MPFTLSFASSRAIILSVASVFFLSSCKKDVSVAVSEPATAAEFLTVAPTVGAAQKTLQFSGYTWTVRATGSGAPGPNSWSSDNVWVDDKGLHIKLAKNAKTGAWECGEIVTQTKFRFGTYQWQVEGRPDQLDKNVVLGLFTYSGKDYYDEMDIEFAKWGDASNPALNYTVYPKAGAPGNPESLLWTTAKQLTLPSASSTHRFVRSASAVKFQSLSGYESDDSQQLWLVPASQQLVSPEYMPVYINLWLQKGKVPSDGKDVEVVIQSFSFS